MKRSYWILWLWVLDLIVALFAAGLFVAQGGFGGGSGRYDLLLGVLAMPWFYVSWPEFAYRHDFVWVVVLPFLMNSGIIGMVHVAWLLRKRSHREA
jgi:hypothetical protein